MSGQSYDSKEEANKGLDAFTERLNALCKEYKVDLVDGYAGGGYAEVCYWTSPAKQGLVVMDRRVT